MHSLSSSCLIPGYFSFGLVLLSAISATHAAPTNSLLNPETDAFIHGVLETWNIGGGVGVAVVRQDTEGNWKVETKGYGNAKADGTKVTENTLFAIGSNSKLFDVLATGLLIHNDSITPPLAWKTKVASVIPDWELQDLVATEQSTILDLMSHRTGLPRHDLMYNDKQDSLPSIIKRLKYLRPSLEFREAMQYTNTMYMVLSFLPTILLPSKPSLAHYVKENIFDRLGMNHTTYSFDVANATGLLADGLVRDLPPAAEDRLGRGTMRAVPFWSQTGGEDGNIMSGPGGVIMSVADAATWLQTLLLQGNNPRTNESVIPSDVLERVSTGITVLSGTAGFPEISPAVYGGGQIGMSYRGHSVIEHGGGTTGFLTQITRLPSDNLGIAVFTNEDIYGSAIQEIIKFNIIDRALGLEPIDWDGRYRTLFVQALVEFPVVPRPENPAVPLTGFSAIAGQYSDPGYGSIELCFISSNTTHASTSCDTMARQASTLLPGVIDPDIPTYLAHWNKTWRSYLKLSHFDGDVFNVTIHSSFPTGNASEPFWVYPGVNSSNFGAIAELATEGGQLGLGLFGIWGPGDGVESPKGLTVHERAEVWFNKV